MGNKIKDNILVKIKTEQDILEQVKLLEMFKKMTPLAMLAEAGAYRDIKNSLLEDVKFIHDNLLKIKDEVIEKEVYVRVKRVELLEGLISDDSRFTGLMDKLKDDAPIKEDVNQAIDVDDETFRLEVQVEALSMLLNSFPKDKNGLVSDEVSNSKGYKKATKMFTVVSNELKRINKINAKDKSRKKTQTRESVAYAKKVREIASEVYAKLIKEKEFSLRG